MSISDFRGGIAVDFRDKRYKGFGEGIKLRGKRGLESIKV